jgi:HAD superfamily hydrolase (TIGR01549 family)
MRTFLIFDLGETLVDFNLTGLWRESLKKDVIPLMYSKLQEIDIGIPNLTSFEAFAEEVYASIARGGLPISLQDRIISYLQILKFPFENTIIQSQLDAFNEVFSIKAKLYDDAISVLEKICNTNYILGLFSNTPWQSPGYMSEKLMKRLDIRKYFTTVQFSGDHCIRKPNPQSMEIVRAALSCNKNQMVYIGNAEVDIKTGANFGIPTIWVKRNGDKLTDKCPPPTYAINKLSDIRSLLPIE